MIVKTKLSEILDELGPHVENASIKGYGASSFIYAVNQGRAIEVSEENGGYWLEFWEKSDDEDAAPVKEMTVDNAQEAAGAAMDWLRGHGAETPTPKQEVPFRFSLSFVEPAEHLMGIIRTFADSPDENRRAVAKAMIDVSAAGAMIKEAILKNAGCDMAPYLDFWFADALVCARSLLEYDDAESRDLGQSLIDAEKSVIRSKESVLAEIKRLGLKRSDT
ncbi:MAG: hypothetical protein HY289_03390 [Planctomycetes bacterium]|nr:hypothetical protein [Planctomycetota bacterium]